MRSTSYASWAAFDVEKELERVDETEKREAQQRQLKKQLQAKENIESSATQAAQQSADILAAQAAVAALKLKRKTRKGSCQETDRVAVVVDAEAEKAAAAELQMQAKLFARKHELLQQILTNRRLGDRILADEKQDWKAAKKGYQTALAAIAELEALAPALQTAETTWLATSKKQDSEGPVFIQDKRCGYEPERRCCNEKQMSSPKKNTNGSLLKADDPLDIIKTFYNDIYVGIGTCEFGENRLAAATEAFKEVLLRDDGQLSAWLKRGEAFEEMDAPLLAMLHYNRIANTDTKHGKAKEALERVKTKLLAEGDASADKNKVEEAISACTEGRTLKEALEQIQSAFEAANVLAVEGFYGYSTKKFQIVLGCLKAVRARPDVGSANDDVVLSVLRELEISCHLNIACGCLEIQRNYVQGLTHCDEALRLNGKYVVTYIRKGQLYHALHNYTEALRCFRTAKGLVVSAVEPRQADERDEMMLRTIDKATDKCEFDRNQYDMEYLRTLAAKSLKSNGLEV